MVRSHAAHCNSSPGDPHPHLVLGGSCRQIVSTTLPHARPPYYFSPSSFFSHSGFSTSSRMMFCPATVLMRPFGYFDSVGLGGPLRRSMALIV